MKSSFSLSSSQLAKFNRQLAAFYETAFERGPLDAAHEALASLIGGQMHLAFVTQGSSEVLFPGGIGEQGRDFLTATMGTVASHPLIYRTGGAVMAISDVLSQQEWTRRAMFQAAADYLKMEDSLGTDLPLDEESTLSVCVIREQRGYAEAERMFFQLLLPHFRSAWRMHGRQRMGEGAMRIHCLNELPDGPVALRRQVTECLDTGSPHPPGPDEHDLAEELAQTIQQMRAGGAARHHPGQTKIHRLQGRHGACAVVLIPPTKDQPGSMVIRHDEGGQHLLLLTPREREVGRWLCEGKTNEEIAIILGIRAGTVKRHVENVFAKLHVPNRTAAARMLMQR
ncbi:helix-turn-helix transcriptional regulator [Prosthecobacter sp. SYSU 5D2]|uniref:response regulator transcription factor n=1 Tax=Prosthecobacter sp. SYSU 5D2 TaxID=3134134 RepID=UPI0031FECBA9